MNLDRFDNWLQMNGPVGIVVREEMESIQGKDAVFFPPTFAPSDDGVAPGYVIDGTKDGKVAVVDTVGSQANRIEPLFKFPPYSDLVPKATVEIGERKLDLLEIGHRAADAVVRYSDQRVRLQAAFLALPTTAMQCRSLNWRRPRLYSGSGIRATPKLNSRD